MREMMNLVGRLLVITLVAGLALGLTNALTSDAIARQTLAKETEAREALFPGAEFTEATAEDLAAVTAQDDRFSSVVSAYYATVEGVLQGCVIRIDGSGYGGAIELTVGVDADGTVTGIRVGSHNETPGLGANLVKDSFTGQFSGKQTPLSVIKGQAGDSEIQAMTSATITSTAVTQAVNTAADYSAALLIRGRG